MAHRKKKPTLKPINGSNWRVWLKKPVIYAPKITCTNTYAYSNKNAYYNCHGVEHKFIQKDKNMTYRGHCL